MQIAFILDVIIVVLLVLTITYAVRLNQRLRQLRSDKNELMELAKTFAEATVKAEAGIKALKISSEALQNDVSKAETLRDDLAYLVERGGRSADEMVASVRAPKAQRSDLDTDDLSPSEDDGLLIQEAIRAATSVGKKQRMAKQDVKVAREQDRGETTRRVSSRREAMPTPPQRAAHPPGAGGDETGARKMGGGLGGLSAEDRLLDKRASQQAPDSIGDTDAARELLKALSSMK